LKAVGCPFEIARRSVSIPTFETESLFRFAFRFPFRLHQIRALFIGRRRVRLKARGVLIGARVAFFAASEGGRFSLAASAAQTPAHVARTPRARSSRASEHSDRLGAHAPGHRAFAEGDANARAAGFPARRARGESAARGARTGGSWGARIVLGADPGLDRASALVARYAAADLANDAPDGNDPERRGGAARTGMLPTHDFCFTLPRASPSAGGSARC
jgi:hypothetical protein